MYKHRVHYYETDKMGITHHSNYIRWMEEARVDLMAKTGWDYGKMEEQGIVSPVIGIECKYKATTTFDDVIDIRLSVAEFKGVKLKVKYIMTKENGDVAFEAVSEHCFLDREGNPVRLKRDYPEFYEAMLALVEK